MKLGPVTKLEKRNEATSKKINNDVISSNCDFIAFFVFMASLEQSEAGFWKHSL